MPEKPVDVVVGCDCGDEGKGRVVDLLAREYDVIARGNGGANAGHTVVPEGSKPLFLHQIPSGVAYPGKLNLIGNGVYADPLRLYDEVAGVRSAGLEVSRKNLLISSAAQLVLPHHIVLDEIREMGDKSQGSTKAGISFVASDKFLREGLRVEDAFKDPRELYELAFEGLCRIRELANLSALDAKYFKSLLSKQEIETIKEKGDNHGIRLSSRYIIEKAEAWVKAVEFLKEFEADTVSELHERLDKGQRALAEGAQGFWLDINHGMYPMVTSSSTTTAGLMDGLGISHEDIGQVYGVTKLIKSNVGGGTLVTKIEEEELANTVRGPKGAVDSEFGTTTERPRDVGYPDFVGLSKAIRINGVSKMIFNKMDLAERYGEIMKIATSYQKDGDEITIAPSSEKDLSGCLPNYDLEIATWLRQEIQKAGNRAELPSTAGGFIDVAEEHLGVKIPMIGVGPERNQVVKL